MNPESVRKEARRLAQEKLAEGYEPLALHSYKDSDGKPLFWKVRCQHPHTQMKWIRPFHHNGTDFVWREPQFQSGKPLYGLDLLAGQADAEVIVCEGENCADALNKIGVLAVTSGGAQSAEAADWTLLRDRRVTIWPDNDDAGASYGRAVSSILQPLGCRVRTLDIDSLDLKQKGDAVDWLQMHPTATVADVRALPRCTSATPEEASPFHAEPPSVAAQAEPAGYFSYDGGFFEAADDGLFFTDLERKKPVTWRISDPLKIEAATRDAQSQGWGRLISIRNPDRINHRLLVRAEDLVGDGLDVLKRRARAGLWMAPGSGTENCC
jgi:5S rRNA maturation endonuclease (ribonuclease M5)